MKRTSLSLPAAVAGPAVAFVVAASTSTIRDQVGASIVGIALAAIVVTAALAGRLAALTTAATAAVTFNFFHTEPFHSLRVNSTGDVVIIALLAGLGLIVSDVSAWLRRREVVSAGRRRATSAPEQLLTMLHESRPVADLWPAVTTSIMDQLGLADCRFEEHQPAALPLISRIAGRSTSGDDGFVLPAHGAAVPVVAQDHPIGYLVLCPQPGMTSLWVERRVVVALADHVAIALTYTGHQIGNAVRTKETSS